MDQIAEELTSGLSVNRGEKLSSFFVRVVQWGLFPAHALASSRQTSSPVEEAFAELARELNGTQVEE